MRKQKTVTTPRSSRFSLLVRVLTREAVLPLVLVSPFLLAAVCSASAQAPAPAQKQTVKPYALIYGTVFGPDDRSAYGVPVKIRRASEKKARWELYSDHSGEFAQRLPVGKADYVVWADLKGYKSPDGRHFQPGPEVTVHIENDDYAVISLHLK